MIRINLNSNDTDPTPTQRTFKVEMRPPLGRSYAEEIAAKYGISYEQLEREMQERGVLGE